MGAQRYARHQATIGIGPMLPYVVYTGVMRCVGHGVESGDRGGEAVPDRPKCNSEISVRMVLNSYIQE